MSAKTASHGLTALEAGPAARNPFRRAVSPVACQDVRQEVLATLADLESEFAIGFVAPRNLGVPAHNIDETKRAGRLEQPGDS